MRILAAVSVPVAFAASLSVACADHGDSSNTDGGAPSAGSTSASGGVAAQGGSGGAGTGAASGDTGVGKSGSAGTPGTSGAAGTSPVGQGGNGGAPGVAGSGGSDASGGVPASAGSDASGGVPASGGSASGGAPEAGSSAGGGLAGSAGAPPVSCPTESEQNFSFFMASQRALAMDSGNADGYGGNLGGLEGADAICQRIAESVSPCQSGKVWHAFLSTSTVNAIDRIGNGPWYDRTGRLFGNTLQDLIAERPAGDIFFSTDVATEDGSPSRNPNGTGNLDNHQTLTGSGADGKVYTQEAEVGRDGAADSCGGEAEWTVEKATCWDWTSSEPLGCPRVGHSWPRMGSGNNWISVWNEGGCLPGGDTSDSGGLDGTRTVGSGGGYGGFYCFAVSN